MNKMRIAAGAGALAVAAFALVAPGSPAPAAEEVDIVSVQQGVVALSGPEDGVRVALPEPAGAADLSPDAKELAVSQGTLAREGPSGVLGELALVDRDTGDVRIRTDFGGAQISGVSYSPVGGLVAFIKDGFELWVMRTDTGQLRQIGDGRSMAPADGFLFDPVFDSLGSSVYVGVVQDSWDGEDDKLDNLWRVSLSGQTTQITHFQPDGQPDGYWLILRRPVPLPDGSVMVNVESYNPLGEHHTYVAHISTSGELTPAGPIPGEAYLVDVAPDRLFYLVFDASSGKGTVMSSDRTEDKASWEKWCEPACDSLVSGVDNAWVKTPDVRVA
ncbi:MAG TPA: hypothetical protein VNE62_10380 [Actinomycetota bacterium]|nr:hypothetical protein [Actinomycetota bacterium]